MAVFKCKMCGGSLEITENSSVVTCEYCGTQQTLPKLNNEKTANLYDRADHFRRNNDFDKAIAVYEQILNEDNTDAEAYWSLVLCRYGVEYVEDPKDNKRIATVNRMQYTSVLADEDYKSAIKYAEPEQKAIYEIEAKEIDTIQKGILAISQREEPFDVFICYKETDNSGRRTPDSVLANELYHQLTGEGYKVFFSRITLEDKLGTAYEPYIFAALNSAKVMVVLGTKPDYFNAVWVRNEWSRFLALIKNGANKVLIPAYRDMDPYNLPEEFSNLQAQDMSKLGFMSDLVRGIKKITQFERAEPIVNNEPVSINAVGNVSPLLERAFIFLEDGDFVSADEYCEKVLDQEPKNAEAYLCKLMAYFKVNMKDNLKNLGLPFENNAHYLKAYRFGDEELKTFLDNTNDYIKNRNEAARKDKLYEDALNLAERGNINNYFDAIEILEDLDGWRDSSEKIELCCEKIGNYAISLIKMHQKETYEQAINLLERIPQWGKSYEYIDKCVAGIALREAEIRQNRYDFALKYMNDHTVSSYTKAIEIFAEIRDYKDAEELIVECRKRRDKLEEDNAALRAERKRRELEEKAARRKKSIIKGICIAVIMLAFIIYLVIDAVVIAPATKYENAYNAIKNKDYVMAYETLISLENYKDSREVAESIFEDYKMQKVKSVDVGDSIYYGTYENRDIEWIVIDKTEDRIMVVSKNVLDYKPYNNRLQNVTWETCSLRTWLNIDFFADAFSVAESEKISTVMVPADLNDNYHSYVSNPGNETEDKIFLLSAHELKRYFYSDEKRVCCNLDGEETWWWLRTPGKNNSGAVDVKPNGRVRYVGGSVEYDGGVRPAMWINIE